MFFDKNMARIIFNFGLFKVKFTLNKNLRINGSDNEIIVYDSAGKRVEKSDALKHFKININGNGNRIEIFENQNYSNNSITINGNENQVKINSSNEIIQHLNVWMFNCANNRKVEIGSNFCCGAVTLYVLEDSEEVHIGSNVLMSDTIAIRTSDGHQIIDIESNEIINKSNGPILIGDNCWIARHVDIFKNSQIPNNTIVACDTLVNKKFTEEYTVLGGYPAQVLKRGVTWKK